MTNGTTPVRKTFQSKRLSACEVDDVVGRQRAGQQDDGHDRQAEGRLVAHHLGRGPHRAEQRVLRARRPARQHDAVDAHRGHGQQEQDADRRVGHLEVGVVAEELDGPVVVAVKAPPMGTMQKVRKAGATDR